MHERIPRRSNRKERSAASRNQSGKSNRGIRETRGKEPHRLLLFRVFRVCRGLFPGVGLKNVAQIARLFRIALQRERKSVTIACSCDRPRLATRQTCADLSCRRFSDSFSSAFFAFSAVKFTSSFSPNSGLLGCELGWGRVGIRVNSCPFVVSYCTAKTLRE